MLGLLIAAIGLAGVAEAQTNTAPAAEPSSEHLAVPVDPVEAEPESQEGLRYDLETGRWVPDTVPLPWRNTLFVWDHTVTTKTFDPNAALSYNPTYYQTFSLRPRYYLDESISIRAREDIVVELTDSDDRARNHEPVFSDLQLSIVNTQIVELPGEITIGAGVTAWAPVSVVSRNANLVLGLEGSTSATRVFDDVVGGLTLQAYGALRYNFHTKNVPTTESDIYAPPFTPSGGAHTPLDQLGAPSNSVLVGTLGLSISLAINDWLSVGVDYEGQWAHGYGLAEACTSPERVVVADAEQLCLPDASATKLRATSYLAIGAAVIPTAWLYVWAGVVSWTSQLAPNGSYYNPFDNPSTSISVTAIFTMDEVYTTVRDALD
jgi:hypothetical protein